MTESTADRTVILVESRTFWLSTLEQTAWRLGFRIVAQTTSSAKAVALIEQCRPDLLITGEEMPEGEPDGIELIALARAAVPGIKSIVLSSRSDDALAPRAFAAGADAYMLRRGRREDFTTAIRQLFAPTLFFATPGAARPGITPGAGQALLTPRELEILQLAAEGHSNAELAQRLWVTEQTVKFHLSNVYRKISVSNRTEASRWAQQQGLLEREPLMREAVA
jgi:two-component system response regulator DevR